MVSLCQRCTGEDDSKHQIDIYGRGDGGGGPEHQTIVSAVSAATGPKLGASPSGKPSSPQQQTMGAKDTPQLPAQAKAPNAQVIGGANKGAEPTSLGQTAPKSPASAKSKDSSPSKKKKGHPGEGEYCLCFPYRARVEEDESMHRACWCLYCCCMGCACHRKPSPLQLRSHCMCIESTWETQEVDGISGGPWSCINTCCFCTTLCMFPRRLGHPNCICCNEDCCGVVGGYAQTQLKSTPEDTGLSSYDHALYEQFVPCYCCCFGIGCVPVFVSCFNSFSKCFCCMARISTGAPDFEGGELCFNFLNCWCCIAHCRVLPELRKNPICAICGWRYKKWNSRPGRDGRDECADSANEIHCDFPTGVYDKDVADSIPACPGVTPYKQNPRERWRDVW